MKRLVFLLFLSVLLLFSCSHKKTGVLNPSNLKSSFISIDAGKDNTLKTSHGAVIKIGANSFDVPAGKKVTIEIKEAYNMQDILKAGLVTESNGKPLMSGGMIFIDATVEGKKINLLKPVKISIPTLAYDNNMQLFKGEISSDSSINWIDPKPLDSGITMKELLFGESLFKANCASCHKPKEEATGPALAGSRLRGTGPDWAYRFTNNTNSMIDKDPYAKFLIRKYGSKMTQFNLPYESLKAIFDYCDNDYSLNYKYESPEVNLKNQETGEFLNPCGTDTVYFKQPLKDEFKVINDAMISPDTMGYADTSFPLNATDLEQLRNGFTDFNETKGMYDFSIKTLGWYNIDAFVKGYGGTEYVNVEVVLDTKETIDAHVYLFYPEKKMLSVGSEKNHVFYFDKIDGKIPLYLYSRVIVFAFGSKADRMYYGSKVFTVKKDQELKVSIKETTEEELKSFIEQNDIEGININVEKKKEFQIYSQPCEGH